MPIRKAKMKVTGKNTVEWSAKNNKNKKFTGKQTGKNTVEWNIKPNKKSLSNVIKSKVGSLKTKYVKAHNEKVKDVLNVLKKSKVPLNVLDRKDVLNRIHLKVELIGPELMTKEAINSVAKDVFRDLKKSKLI